jgi:predicted AAA+ superfamily ATPase
MKIKNIKEIEKFLPKRQIDREIRQSLVKGLTQKEVMILFGPRQVGKSVEVWKMIEGLLRTGGSDIFYFNFDVLPIEVSDPEEFLRWIKSMSGEGKIYVFIDEAQRLANIGRWIKYLYDLKTGIKWVLTGSASLDLKNRTKESLVGRKIEYFLEPLSLREIVKDGNMELGKVEKDFEGLNQKLREYLVFGGYPGVVTITGLDEKKQKLADISETYLISDISQMYGIEDKQNLKMVAIYLAENIGGILSKDNLSNLTGIGKHEVVKCLEALEGGFVVRKIRSFAKDKTKELTHRSKVYFEDLGIRNALLGKLSSEKILMDRGKLFENLVIKMLSEKWGWENIKYWRTTNQTEVDAVVIKAEGRIEAYEAKYSQLKSMPKNLVSFGQRYGQILDKTEVVWSGNWWKV